MNTQPAVSAPNVLTNTLKSDKKESSLPRVVKASTPESESYFYVEERPATPMPSPQDLAAERRIFKSLFIDVSIRNMSIREDGDKKHTSPKSKE